MVTNREHKDRLFTFIFGSEENREFTLSLYNAVNNSNYTDASAIQITTIKDILYMGMRNDMSFIISDQMNLYEQQSTYNPNMPVRLLQYVGHLYEQHIAKNNLHIYGKKQLTLPVPRLVVFYNGTTDKPDEVILKLSDSFPENAVSDVEVKVRMLNINYGKNKALLDACRPLNEYAWVIDRIRLNQDKGMTAIDAINDTVANVPDNFRLYHFLKAHRAEVNGMLMGEYDEKKVMNQFKEEGKAEGLKEGKDIGLKEGKDIGLKEGKDIGLKEGKDIGLKEGKDIGLKEGKDIGLKEGKDIGQLTTLISLVKDGDITAERAAQKAGMTLEAFHNAMETSL